MANHRTLRWSVTINYRAENGVVHVEHDLKELSELHDIVERGPDWHTIENIDIRLRYGSRSLTIEKASRL